MVLSVPFGQLVQIVADGVVGVDLLGIDILLDVALRTAFLENILALGLDEDAVQCTLCQWAVILRTAVLALVGKFQFAVEHVLAERIALRQEHFYTQ